MKSLQVNPSLNIKEEACFTFIKCMQYIVIIVYQRLNFLHAKQRNKFLICSSMLLEGDHVLAIPARPGVHYLACHLVFYNDVAVVIFFVYNPESRSVDTHRLFSANIDNMVTSYLPKLIWGF